jgi:hypothetical protein
MTMTGRQALVRRLTGEERDARCHALQLSQDEDRYYREREFYGERARHLLVRG